MATTPEQATALINAVEAVRVCIKELGTVPSGILYARLMQYMNIATYQRLLDILVEAKQITVSNHLITYVGRL
jgi:hypothetical protein